jgi:hypothetical protein
MATLAAALEIELPDDQAEDAHNLHPSLRGEGESVRFTHAHNTSKYAYARHHDHWPRDDAECG